MQRPAHGFLKQQDDLVQPGNSNILEQLEEALGSNSRAATEVRLQDIEEALRPIFDALPKRFSGAKVGPPAARYALHRLFIQRHGWHVKELFDDRLNSTGLDLHELAVFASILEHLIHSE